MSLLHGINNKMTVDLHVSGYCIGDASIVNPGKKRSKIRFHAVWMHIFLPGYGHVVADTGYSPEFRVATRSFPERLYAWATPMTIDEDKTAAAILKKKGVNPGEVKYVIITHFHGDHVCGLKDFPNAKFICSRAALEQVKAVSGFGAVKRGILKKLLPDDFMQRVLLIEDIAKVSRVLDGGLQSYSFFDNTDIWFVSVPGHARGMVGLLIKGAERTLFYAADAQWDKAVFEAGILPRKIVKLFFDSWEDFIDTTERLQQYMAANPDTLLLFTHCEQTLTYVSNEV